MFFFVFFFNDTATTEIYTLSLHDALPISRSRPVMRAPMAIPAATGIESPSMLIGPTMTGSWTPSPGRLTIWMFRSRRSEEHTSELQSRQYLVCRLLLEKKKTTNIVNNTES